MLTISSAFLHLRVVALWGILVVNFVASAVLAQQTQGTPSLQVASLASAKTLLVERRYSEAAQMLTTLAKKDSLNAELFRCLGDSYLALEQQDAAAIAYERSLALEPSNEVVMLALAKLYREREQYSEARTLYFQALKLSTPKPNQSIPLGIAHTYYAQQRYDSALVWYASVSAVPGAVHPPAWVFLQKARCYGELGEEARAEDAYTSAVTLAPKNAAYALERIDYWMKKGLRNEAALNVVEDYAQQAITIFPNDTRFYRRRAEALLQLRRPETACNVLMACVHLGDSSAEVWRDAAITFNMRKQYRTADSLFEIAQKKFNEKSEFDSRLLYFRAVAKRELGATDEAVKLFRLAMFAGGKGKQVADIHTQIGLTERRAGRNELARSFYEHALATDSSKAEPYYELATLLDDVSIRFSTEEARTRHRELVAPLYFKFLERTTNKRLKTVEFALMRLYLLGCRYEEVSQHCGWLKASNTDASGIAVDNVSSSTSGTIIQRTAPATDVAMDSLVQQRDRQREQGDTLRQWYDASGSRIAQPEGDSTKGDSTTRSTDKPDRGTDTTRKSRQN